MISIYSIVRPSARPFFLDLGLALGLLCAWLSLGGFEPLVAAATDELRLVVTTGAYHLQWPLGPAVFGVAGLVLAWLRYCFFDGGPQLQERLQRATLLAAVLLALRLLALCDPLTYFFPFLTLLWSPHALWAVALVFFGYVHLPTENGRVSPRTDAYIAAVLLALCLPLYFLYALYFCQITMLHGDEGQYLRVTQSLLHDGDMDLANNLSVEQTNEFHVIKFAVHKAPASPEGKVHSVLVIAASLYALIAFHYAFSGDWMGPLRPGSGAWGEGALDMAIWLISLPGHWLHVNKGILNSSPIYCFALFGLLALVRLRDRRVAIAIGLYAATAAILGPVRRRSGLSTPLGWVTLSPESTS